MSENPENETRPARRKRQTLPPKGTAARARLACGLWSDMSREEIEQIKHDIFSTRRSRGSVPRTDD
jgi:hypothetical protein